MRACAALVLLLAAAASCLVIMPLTRDETRIDLMQMHVPHVQNESACRGGTAGLITDTAEGWARRLAAAQAQKQRQVAASGPGSTWRSIFTHNWEPTFSCAYKERIGAPGDGGKWVCDPSTLRDLRPRPSIISVGSNGDFSFEDHAFAYFPWADIHTIDPGDYQAPEYVVYHRHALMKDNFVRVLDECVGMDGQVDILKIDIEGGEYDALLALNDFRVRDRIAQIQVEIHMFAKTGDDLNDLMRMITTHYEIFSKEINVWGACEFGLVRVDWRAVCE